MPRSASAATLDGPTTATGTWAGHCGSAGAFCTFASASSANETALGLTKTTSA